MKFHHDNSKMKVDWTVEDGPVCNVSTGYEVRVTRVVITTYDDGYQDIAVYGRRLTNQGEFHKVDTSLHAVYGHDKERIIEALHRQQEV